MSDSNTPIILYTSNFCAHALIVERFMEENEIDVELIHIDRDPEARQKVMALNGGFASVPTLVFPDGTHLTEPSLRELRACLEMPQPGVRKWVRSLLGGDEQ